MTSSGYTLPVWVAAAAVAAVQRLRGEPLSSSAAPEVLLQLQPDADAPAAPLEAVAVEGAALLGMTAVGALIAAVPKLLRNRGSYWAHESALGCAGAFLCGVGMMMGLHLAGSGRIVSAMLEGSTGAFGFVIMAWIAGCVTALLAGRRRA